MRRAERILLYVPLLNEGTDVLRPTTGVFVGPDLVRVEPMEDYDPESEEWEFLPGREVRCLAEFRGGRQVLVARARAIESFRGLSCTGEVGSRHDLTSH
jgi:hypothetical protein